MTNRRVAVTGVGAVSALGLGVPAFRDALAAGRSGIAEITGFDTSTLRLCHAAEVKALDFAELLEKQELELTDRFARFALLTAREAIQQSGLELTKELQQRAAVVTGSCLGGKVYEEWGYERILAEGRLRVHPLSIPRVMLNSAASMISMALGLAGPTFNVASACSSSNHAIGHAFWMVRSGLADLALAGGSETPVVLGQMRAWDALRVVAPDTCRPFSLERKGMILGEGGAMLVLEPWEHATARGAHILAEIVGFGMTADAHHITQPTVEGPAAAITAALADGGLAPEQVGYINAHGTGTKLNDVTETRAIRQVFGAHADSLAVSSTKSMHGHALGAAGALEAVATVLALDGNLLPPTANFQTPDPECDLDVIPNEARAAEVDGALSDSFAFGGLNAVLAFRHARD